MNMTVSTTRAVVDDAQIRNLIADVSATRIISEMETSPGR